MSIYSRSITLKLKFTKTHTRYVLLTQNEPTYLLSNSCWWHVHNPDNPAEIRCWVPQKFCILDRVRTSGLWRQKFCARFRCDRDSWNYFNSLTNNINRDYYLNIYLLFRVWHSSGNYNLFDKLQDRHGRSAEIRHHRNSALQPFWSQWRKVS